LPGSISAFVQRAGRCARAPGRVGLAVLLVEQSAYGIVLDGQGAKPPAKGNKEAKKGGKAVEGKVKKLTNGEMKAKRNYAEARGSKRGAEGGKHDAVLIRDSLPIDGEAADEGLLSLVQSGTCRRDILTAVYNNLTAGTHLPIATTEFINSPNVLSTNCSLLRYLRAFAAKSNASRQSTQSAKTKKGQVRRSLPRCTGCVT
jgi:hypothetical protein